MKKFKEAIAVLILLALLSPLAIAEDAFNTDAKSDTSTSKDCELSLAPMYLWAVSIKGDQPVNGIEVDTDVPLVTSSII